MSFVMESVLELSRQATSLTDTFAGDFMSTKDNPIPAMPWELAASQVLSISQSEFRYVFAFFLSVAVGCGICLFRSPTCEFLSSLRHPAIVSEAPLLCAASQHQP